MSRSRRVAEVASGVVRQPDRRCCAPKRLAFRPRMLIAAVLIALGLSGCGKPSAADRYVRPETVLDFATLFGQHCSACHGMDGQLGPAPPLNDPMFLDLISKRQLVAVIAQGSQRTPMPAFAISHGGKLTDEQINSLADGIRGQWRKSRGKTQTAMPVETWPDYTVTEADPAGIADGNLTNGRVVFEAACQRCHGANGREADGQSSADGGILGHAFGELVSDQFLRRIVITGRPDLDMPSYIDSGTQSLLNRPLTNTEIVDVVAYLRDEQRHKD